MNCTKAIAIELTERPFTGGMTPEHVAILARHAHAAEFKADQVIFRESKTA